MNPLNTDDAGASDAHASAAGQTPHSTEAVMPACVTVPRWRWRVYVHPASWMFGIFTMIVLGILAAVVVGACVAVGFSAAPNASISQLSTVQLVTIIVIDLVIAAGGCFPVIGIYSPVNLLFFITNLLLITFLKPKTFPTKVEIG